jgi:hypothetical protein
MIRKVLLITVLFLMSVSFAHAADVTLAWDANTDPRVTGYKLYYGTTTRTYGPGVATGKVTQFTLTGVAEGQNVFFAVTAVAAAENLESVYSIELPCWTVIPSVVGPGTITPAITKVVSNVTGQAFTITPNTGAQIKDVAVDGVSIGKVTSHAFINVNTSHTIKATFEMIPLVNPVDGLKIK